MLWANRNDSMKIRKNTIIGFCVGMIIGGAVTILGVAPKMVALLMRPLIWLNAGFNPYPSESPANIVFAIPLMFLYWGCLGAIAGLILSAVINSFQRKSRH